MVPLKASKVAVLITFLFLTLVLSQSSYEEIKTFEGDVLKVSNSDTLQVINQEGTELRIKMYAVMLPKSKRGIR